MSSIPKPKKKTIWKKWWLWASAIILALIIISIVGGMIAGSNAALEQYSNLEESVSAERRDLTKVITTNGTIAADQVAQVVYTAAGTVEEVKVSVGDSVVKGDELVIIDPEFGSTVAIEAPFDGRVLSNDAFYGAPATPGLPALTLGYNTTHAVFLASESEVIDLEAGQEVIITIPSYNSGRDTYEGIVRFVDVQKTSALAAGGQSADSGYLVEVSLGTVPSELQQTIGLTVDMDIEVGRENDTLSIESSALQYDDNDQPFVYELPDINEEFVMEAKDAEDITDILSKKYVNTGFKGDQYIEITSGLREGEQVLLYVPISESSLPF